MKNYLFVGVQGSTLAHAVQGLDELLRSQHAKTDFEILQIFVCHEMSPGKITTGQPAVVCNVIAVLISPHNIQEEEPGQENKLWIDKGEA